MSRSRARSDPLPQDIKYQFVNQQSSYSPRISQVQWSLNEEYILFLHGLEYTREQILALLRERRGFCPSINQLNAQMKIWGLRVYRKSSKIENFARILPSWNEISTITSSSRRIRSNTISGLPATQSSELTTSAARSEHSSDSILTSASNFVAEDMLDGVEGNKTTLIGERTLSPTWNTTIKNQLNLTAEPFGISSRETYGSSKFLDLFPELQRYELCSCPVLSRDKLCQECAKSREIAPISLDDPICDLEPSLSVRKHDRAMFENASQLSERSERSMFSLAMRLKNDFDPFGIMNKSSILSQGTSVCSSGNWSFRRLTGLGFHLGSVDFMEVEG